MLAEDQNLFATIPPRHSFQIPILRLLNMLGTITMGSAILSGLACNLRVSDLILALYQPDL